MYHKIRLLFNKNKKSYYCFYRILGSFPRNIHYYEIALMHKSIKQRGENGRCINNERLEFLGDAILEAIVSDILFRRFGSHNEGFLTATRSKMVKRETLNHIAKQIGLDGLIRTDVSLSTTHNNYISGNTFEALLGALYLDRGYRACYRFVAERIVGAYIDLDTISHQEENFKSKLLEWGQKHRVPISFKLLNESMDKDFSPMFQSVVYIGDMEVGRGEGYTKKESHQKAAQGALRTIRSTKNFLIQIGDDSASREQSQAVGELVEPCLDYAEAQPVMGAANDNN